MPVHDAPAAPPHCSAPLPPPFPQDPFLLRFKDVRGELRTRMLGHVRGLTACPSLGAQFKAKVGRAAHGLVDVSCSLRARSFAARGCMLESVSVLQLLNLCHGV